MAAHAGLGPRVNLTVEERVWLDRNREKLVLYFNTERPPFEFISPSGIFSGLGADMIKEVERRLGVIFLKHPSGQRVKILAALESGECALVPTLVKTRERERFLAFTEPYAEVPVVIIGTRHMGSGLTLADLGGRRVAVVAGNATEEYLREKAGGKVQVVSMPHVRDALQAVSFGLVDVLVESTGVSAYYMDKEGIVNLRIVGGTDYVYAMSIGVSRRYPLLASAVQKAFEAIPETEREQLRRRWMVLKEAEGLSPRARRLLIVATVFTVILLSGLLLISYVLRRRLKEKVESLKIARQELLAQGDRLTLAMEATNAGVWDYHPGSDRITLSRELYTMLGYETGPSEVLLDQWARQIHPEDVTGLRQRLKDYVDSGGEGEFESEFRLKKSDGSWCWLLAKGRTIGRDEAGRPSRIVGLDLNIQSIKEVQEELARSESRFRAIFDNAPYSIAISRLEDGTYLDANRAFLESRNISRHELGSYKSGDFVNVSPEELQGYVDRLLRDGFLKNVETVIRQLDGIERNLIFSSVLLDLQGQKCALSMTVDITDQKRAEQSLKDSEARFRSLFRMAPTALVEITLDGVVIEANDRAKKLLGYSLEGGLNLEGLWKKVYPDPFYRKWAASTWQRSIEEALQGNGLVQPEKHTVTCRDGSVKTLMIGASLTGGSVLVSFDDITRRDEEERARIESLEMLRATLNTTPDGILVVNRQRRIIQVNSQFYKMWQIPESMRTIADERVLLEFVSNQLEDPDLFVDEVNALYDKDCDDFKEIQLNGGRVFERYSSPLIVNGEKSGRVWDIRDITERRRAEAERQELQEQLHQALKLEAVGILAGGVAHDFNNMLGAIIGYTELILNALDSKDPLRENLGKILDAAERSANLTRQLLAFARKQTVAPVVLDINESVAHMLRMLHRIIGENIELVWRPGPFDCTVNIDPSQLDQILTNLCVNARDAIKDVGRITITTCAVFLDENACRISPDGVPGDYVRLSVSDNGCGMDPETLKHAFEPFFTTKGAGQGTGLGLATVYGVVKQNDGFVHIYSESGMGTTFNLYLPHHKKDETESHKEVPGEELPMGCGEIILMVEDDPTLRQMGEMMLNRLGYNVLVAATPGDAIRMAEEAGDTLKMFITDVVMPEMNGRELADRLIAVRPSLRHLFMSGYTADVIAHRGVLDEGVNFIQKPFSFKDLAVKIRTVLDRDEEKS
jgi:PAS domain S-box-containing protein